MKCLWTDSQAHHDSCGSRSVCRQAEGLVVLKQGEKVVVAVGGKVGGVKV